MMQGARTLLRLRVTVKTEAGVLRGGRRLCEPGVFEIHGGYGRLLRGLW